MKTHKSYKKHLITNGILMMVVGGLVFYFQKDAVQNILSTIFYVIGATHLIELWSVLFLKRDKKEPIKRTFLQGCFWIAIALLTDFTSLTVNMLVRIIGLYQIFNGLVKFVTFGLYRISKTKGSWRFLLDGLIYGLFGLSAFLFPQEDSEIQFIMIGCYMMFLGFAYLRDGLFFESEKRYGDLKRRIRVSLPVWIAFLMPQAALMEINKKLAGEEVKSKRQFAAEKETPSDLQIMVHTSESGFNRVGHVDICIDGRVISYGNYDTNSETLFGMVGDGVLFKVEKSSYIDFCKANSGKTLFEYGLRLNDQQKASIQRKIQEIDDLAEEWSPSQFVKAKKPGLKEEIMYSYRLKNELGAELFKFKSSRFKKYFVLSTNCVLLADSIIGASGTDILSVNGVITPGTYLDYLDREFTKPNSLVVSKIVHKNRDA